MSSVFDGLIRKSEGLSAGVPVPAYTSRISLTGTLLPLAGSINSFSGSGAFLFGLLVCCEHMQIIAATTTRINKLVTTAFFIMPRLKPLHDRLSLYVPMIVDPKENKFYEQNDIAVFAVFYLSYTKIHRNAAEKIPAPAYQPGRSIAHSQVCRAVKNMARVQPPVIADKKEICNDKI